MRETRYPEVPLFEAENFWLLPVAMLQLAGGAVKSTMVVVVAAAGAAK